MQRYVPEVRQGDKRIILVDGEFAGAINRVPAPGEARSNMHVGGKAEAASLSPREKTICDALGPELKARGLVFTGIDVIGAYLTEINVTSPTGIQEIKRFGGRRQRRADLGRDRKAFESAPIARAAEALTGFLYPMSRPPDEKQAQSC